MCLGSGWMDFLLKTMAICGGYHHHHYLLRTWGRNALEERCPLLIPLTFLPKKHPELAREAQSNYHFGVKFIKLKDSELKFPKFIWALLPFSRFLHWWKWIIWGHLESQWHNWDSPLAFYLHLVFPEQGYLIFAQLPEKQNLCFSAFSSELKLFLLSLVAITLQKWGHFRGHPCPTLGLAY